MTKTTTKRDVRRAFKEAVQEFIRVRPNMGSLDTALRQEANNASMRVRTLMQDLHSRKDADYICKVFKRYEIT